MIGNGHGDTGFGHIEGRLIGRVIVGEEDGAFFRGHREAVGVTAHGGGQHHAGAVIVGEHQRALDGAGRQNDGLAGERDQDLPGLALLRIGTKMVTALDEHGEIAVI